jgi:hypothetical protein
MKPKLTSLVLSFAVLITISGSATAKPLNPQQTKLVNNASTVNTRSPKVQAKLSIASINNWQFFSIKQDLGTSYTPQQAADWNQIAILSKPYRSNLANAPKPFRYWRFSDIKEDLGASYTPQQSADWNRLAILTKPYRS